MYWSIAMTELVESVTGPMSVMSTSLISSISDECLANYFTYHFLLDSYFGGNYVAPRISTITYFPFREPDLRYLG